VKKASAKGMKAAEIPEILRDGLSFPLTDAEKKRLDTIRDLRNRIAHGGAHRLSLKDALDANGDLHSLATRIDQHSVEHFFVLEAYA
jgi:hypothetical protein